MIRTPPPDPPSPASAASGTGWRAVWQRWWSVRAVLAKPFDLGGLEAQVTASIGMALFPDDAGLGDELLQAADAAVYAAKQQGRNGCARLR
jgi:GGDEF domain-containing protein